MRGSRSSNSRGFTLFETLAVIVVTSVLSMVLVPLIAETGSAFADMSEMRDRTESASCAMERIVRAIRETDDQAASNGTPDITAASASSITFGDGTQITLTGTTLWLTEPGTTASPLCQNVATFAITYLGSDGLALDISVAANRALVQRLNLRIACTRAAELRTSVFLRCTLGAS